MLLSPVRLSVSNGHVEYLSQWDVPVSYTVIGTSFAFFGRTMKIGFSVVGQTSFHMLRSHFINQTTIV